MGFSDLPTIERVEDYLDTAFKKARTQARNHTLGDNEKSTLNREKSLALIKIATVSNTLISKFSKIIAKYPNFDNLSEFYTQLIKSTIDYKYLKKTLGSINWVTIKLKEMQKRFSWNIKQADSPKKVGDLLNQYYGRVSSVIKQIKKELEFLHKARQMMRTYPNLKEEFTIAIAGFPNVGKSTLLKKITSAKPEINSYAFTTKKLNTGYKEINALKFQFIDTPGTLNRPEKMNNVEHQAYLAMRYVADLLLYVFDITESCGYTLAEQKKLLSRLKDFDKPIICFLSKTDLLYDEQIEGFESFFTNKKIPLFTNLEDIEKSILKTYRDKYVKKK